MRLPGYCEVCRRVRQVRVSPQNLVLKRYVGVCAQCETRGKR